MTVAIRARLDVNRKHSLKALCPAHGRQRPVAIHPAPRLPRHDPGPEFEVRGEHAMEALDLIDPPRRFIPDSLAFQLFYFRKTLSNLT